MGATWSVGGKEKHLLVSCSYQNNTKNSIKKMKIYVSVQVVLSRAKPDISGSELFKTHITRQCTFTKPTFFRIGKTTIANTHTKFGQFSVRTPWTTAGRCEARNSGRGTHKSGCDR